jgi:Protein of unknown function (DUF2865)
LRIEFTHQRLWRRAIRVAALFLAASLLPAPRSASAENLFDLFFRGLQNQRQAPAQASFFANPFGQNQPSAPRPVASVAGPAFCVRSCDGKYFPLVRGNASPVQMCQAFCPASPTKVFFGSIIDNAITLNGERYADSENAFAYRKALRAECTCNGRDAAGLAPVDLTFDTSLRAGDVIATTDGLVAYSGIKLGNNNSPEFLPVASYPGLTAEVRARLGEMRVAPLAADTLASESRRPNGNVPSPIVPGKLPMRDKRAALN